MGVGVLILGVSLSEGMKVYYEGVNTLGSKIKISEFDIHFSKIEKEKKENWISEKGIFLVARNNYKFEIEAERRLYLDTGMPSTEAGIKRNLASHLYVVMGQEQPPGSGNRIIRVYYNPNIILIWIGAIIMALGLSLIHI